MTTEASAPEDLGVLTAEEIKLIGFLRNENYPAANNLVSTKFEKVNWTYEHRLAFAILGQLALTGALAPDTLVNPSADYIAHLIDETAEAIQDGMYVLGGVNDLQKLMNDTSMAKGEDLP